MATIRQAVTHIRESRWFESICTLQGKPDQYATHILRSVRIWSQIRRISCGQRIATFHVVVNRFEQIHCSREEGLLAQPIARQLTGPRVHTQLLSKNNHRSSGEKISFCWQPATRLIGSISPACNRYVQYLLASTNPSVLNRHRRELQPPKGSTRSQVIQSQYSLKWNGDMKHLSSTRGLSTTRRLAKSISTRGLSTTRRLAKSISTPSSD
jgi:hypothetical protein